MPMVSHPASVSALLISAVCAAFVVSGCGKKEGPSSAPAAVGTGTPANAAPAVPKAMLETGVTRQQLEAASLEPACSLEVVVELPSEKRFTASSATYTIPRDMTAKLIGFGTIKSKGTELGAFTAFLAASGAVYKAMGQTNLDRPDVVTFFNAPGMLKAGFQVDVDLKDVPAGDYAVYLRSAAGTTCPTHHTIRIQ